MAAPSPVSEQVEVQSQWPNVTISLPWPSVPFELACPDTKVKCLPLANTASSTCAEPETQTAEALSSLLLGCNQRSHERSCLYIDIGCNLGVFAAQAAMHGAAVECFEPYPLFVAAARRTSQIINRPMDVRHRAVVADGGGPKMHTFDRPPYFPCGIGAPSWPTSARASSGAPGPSYSAATTTLRALLTGRRVTVLKIDIDANEGALLHVAVRMIERNETCAAEIGTATHTHHARTMTDMLTRSACAAVLCHPIVGASTRS